MQTYEEIKREWQTATLKAMYEPARFTVIPSAWLEKGDSIFEGDKIYMAECDIYRNLFFMNNDVSEKNIAMAIRYAINKLNKFIDRL